MLRDDTIFALASGAGRAGVAVLRLSGPDAGPALLALAGRSRLPEPRRAVLLDVRDAAGDVIDRGLALWFPGPGSFTGEDVVELHLHGGRAVLRAAFAALAELPGLRPAEPGEFSRRAFENGRLDLTAAEGLADLVAADTEAQRRQALRQMAGALGALYEGWRAALVRALAHLEADIDFPDEDLPGGIADRVAPEIAALRAAIAAHLDDRRGGERLRDGVQVVILGEPNVGKSSLLNALARRDVAIVSQVAGTTRDVIEVQLDLNGLPVVLADTAGLRDAGDAIEEEGMRRALQRAETADFRLILAEAAAWPALPPAVSSLLSGADSLLVLTKADLAMTLSADMPGLAVSARTGDGLPALLDALRDAVAERIGGAAAAPGVTRERHRRALLDCLAALDRFLAAPAGAELAAEEVRLAVRALGRITGRVDVEDVLDVVFSSFCIGK